jgi:hypothetical protein
MGAGTSPICLAGVSKELPSWNAMSGKSMHSSQQTEGRQLGKLVQLGIGGDEENFGIQESLLLVGSPTADR